MSKLIKLSKGRYQGANGIARDMHDGSGRNRTINKWLVTPANGTPSYFVPSLSRAREVIA